MDNVLEIVQINRLLDIYGKLLTKSQYEIMKDYYDFNLSLSEISEMRKISRSAVQDSLKKSVAKLNEIEKKVGICKVIDSYKDKNKQFVDEFEESLKNGI